MRRSINKKLLGANIAYYRKLRNLEPAELAQKCEYSTVMINKVEAGDKHPSVPLLILIAYHLEVSLDTLVRGCLENEQGKGIGHENGAAICDKNCPHFSGTQ